MPPVQNSKDIDRQILAEKIIKLIDQFPIIELDAGHKWNLTDGTVVLADDIVTGMDAKLRLTLSSAHKIIVECDTSPGGNHKAVKIFKRGSQATGHVAVTAPAAKPTTGLLEYFVPPFYNKLLLNFRCGKDWENCCSRNVQFMGHKGCVVGSTKIRVKKVSNGNTPIETTLD